MIKNYSIIFDKLQKEFYLDFWKKEVVFKDYCFLNHHSKIIKSKPLYKGNRRFSSHKNSKEFLGHKKSLIFSCINVPKMLCIFDTFLQ